MERRIPRKILWFLPSQKLTNISHLKKWKLGRRSIRFLLGARLPGVLRRCHVPSVPTVPSQGTAKAWSLPCLEYSAKKAWNCSLRPSRGAIFSFSRRFFPGRCGFFSSVIFEGSMEVKISTQLVGGWATLCERKGIVVNLHHVRNFLDLSKVTDIEPARKPSQEEPI